MLLISISEYMRTAPGHIFSAPRWEELKRSIATGTMAGESPIPLIMDTKLALRFRLLVLTFRGREFDCQSGVWKSFQNKFSIQAFDVGKNVTNSDIGIHAYCSWTNLNGSPFGGFQKVYADSSNRWFVTNTRWGDYESGGTITVTCLNLPGAGI